MSRARATKQAPAAGRGTLSRSVVLETAARLFNIQGFDRTSMNDIAAALGVTKPSLYYYFPSKDELLNASITEAASGFEKVLEDTISGDLPAIEKLRIVMRHYARAMRADVFRALILADERTLTKAGVKLVTASKRQINNVVIDLLTQAQKDGAIEISDPKTVSFALFGMYNWMAFWRGQDWDTNADQIELVFEDFMLNGVRGRLAPRDRT